MSCVMTAIVEAPCSASRSECLTFEPRIRVWVYAGETGKRGDIALDLHRRISGPHRAWRNAALAEHAARTDERVLPDLDAGKDRAVRADARAAADGRTLHALLVRGALRMRIIGEDDMRPEEDVVLDGHELEETPGVDPHVRADAVAELERRVRPDGDVVPDDVVLTDRRALAGLKARADRRAGVDRGERPDHGVRPD